MGLYVFRMINMPQAINMPQDINKPQAINMPKHKGYCGKGR